MRWLEPHGSAGDDAMLTPPPNTAAGMAHSTQCGHTALPPGQKTNPRRRADPGLCRPPAAAHLRRARAGAVATACLRCGPPTRPQIWSTAGSAVGLHQTFYHVVLANQSILSLPHLPALPTRFQYYCYCNYIAQYLIPLSPTPRFYAIYTIHHTILRIAISCKG